MGYFSLYKYRQKTINIIIYLFIKTSSTLMRQLTTSLILSILDSERSDE